MQKQEEKEIIGKEVTQEQQGVKEKERDRNVTTAKAMGT